MSYLSFSFLCLFLPITFCLQFVLPSKGKHLLMIVSSLMFYAWGEPLYVFGLIALCALTYGLGKWITYEQDERSRKQLLWLGCIACVFMLFYFKFDDVLFKWIWHLSNGQADMEQWIMPLGCSFVLFSAISYLSDIYRRRVSDCGWLMTFTYLTFFPKLLMGPIMPYHRFVKENQTVKLTMTLMEHGARLFVIGMAQKLLLADHFAVVATQIRLDNSVLGVWLASIAFTLQLYFDFAGYSMMANGIANMFGYRLMENFHHPYHALSIRDFWHRWHISLSQWFRDYVYIPLGGSRLGRMKYVRNLLIVWLLTGLWHGTSWNFLLWGFYYAVILLIESLFLKHFLRLLPKFMCWCYTFFLVNLGWVLFANTDFSDLLYQLSHMFFLASAPLFSSDSLYYLQTYGSFFLLVLLIGVPYGKLFITQIYRRFRYHELIDVILFSLLLILCFSYLIANGYQTFLYTQF